MKMNKKQPPHSHGAKLQTSRIRGNKKYKHFMRLANNSPAKVTFKGALRSERPFLAAESLLKKMKNAFYFTLKTLFVFKIFKFLS